MRRRVSFKKILALSALLVVIKLVFLPKGQAHSQQISNEPRLEPKIDHQQQWQQQQVEAQALVDSQTAIVAAPVTTWTSQQDVLEDVQVLQSFGLSAKFEYRRICLTATPRPNVQRSSVVNTKTAFFRSPEGTILANDDRLGLSETNSPSGCSFELSVDVPAFDALAEVDTSWLFLGMATTIPRLKSSLLEMSRWLSNTSTTLQVLIVDHASLDSIKPAVEEISQKAAALHINLLFAAHKYPWETDGRKSFGLAEVMLDNAADSTKWFGIIDDDTFFLSIPQMVKALNAYDHSQLYYIGALSEGISRIAGEGFMARGGAGFFLSPPLMRILVDNNQECRELDANYGDLLWRDCIIEFTSPTVPLTQLSGLNQLDFWKDPSGWYESYLNPLYTLHHWKSWHVHPVPLAHLVTDVAGPDSLLQRYTFLDDTVLSNGYSLVHYPHGEPDLRRTELTMVEDVGIAEYPPKREFLHRMGRTREAMKIGRTKVQWKFETAISARDGSIKQFYVKKAWTKQGQNIDSVIQIDWRAA